MNRQVLLLIQTWEIRWKSGYLGEIFLWNWLTHNQAKTTAISLFSVNNQTCPEYLLIDNRIKEALLSNAHLKYRQIPGQFLGQLWEKFHGWFIWHFCVKFWRNVVVSFTNKLSDSCLAVIRQSSGSQHTSNCNEFIRFVIHCSAYGT